MDFLLAFVLCISVLQQIENVRANHEIRTSRSIPNGNFKNLKITEQKLISSELKTKIQCISMCRERTTCLSFSYNTITQMCVLFDKDFTDVSSTAYDSEEGWLYFYVIKKSEQKGAVCVGPSLPGICSLYCLSYIEQSVSHDQLAGICESYSGGELVKIDRGLKQYCVEQLLANEINGDVYIQGRKFNELQTTWWYNDGTNITFFNWNTASGQPNFRLGEIYLGVRKSQGYKWHDVRNDELTAAVCQQI